ncbi:MAG TPA: carboxypeptidase-like regulatory domain-containing protein, partial [Terriglobales bacterium]|nr:carboxypeptidase-like regulatory domain-containing protein [Terriglobales bacterium]
MNLASGRKRFLHHGALAFAIFAICVVSASAQIDRGAIVGRVVDASGAVVPKAAVTVTNKATGVAVGTSTNEIGEYQALALIPGTYSVRVSAQGFDTVVHDNIELHVQDRLSIEVTLRVGSVSQEVVVTGREPLLQTQSADVG